MITPFGENLRVVQSNGLVGYGASTYPTSVRPTVNLLSKISISSGMGTLSDPYRLVKDEQKTVGGTTLLSTRYTGEYVKFNNELYRIVNIENNLTKVTAVATPTALSNQQFHSNNKAIFSSSTIKNSLESYYQNLNL